ncbi:MAG: ComEC/Rec2 family competence protein, partial [Flavobacteriaceae bacterium]|nr:ComEC/Rec2 family competence protein [Flavobacteriaceae bacterium]
MKKLLQFVPTYMVFFLMIGILIGYYFPINPLYILTLLLIEIILLTAFYFSIKQQNQLSIYFTLLIYFTTISLGISTITIKNELNSKHHYRHFIAKETSSEAVFNQKYILKLEIKKVLKSAYHQQKYVAKVVAVHNRESIGKVLLTIQADTLSKPLKVDQTLLIYADFKPIEQPKNPYYFDYRNYLKKQQIHHQIFTKKNEYKILPSNSSLVGLAEQLIAIINQKLAPYAIAKEELAIINAFLLGDRQDISNDLMESYINAGAIHIMAISGMHFGILFLILNALLKPIEGVKNGKIWKMFLIVLLLWIYALIAGLSGSVVRAVLMFSLVALATNMHKLTNIYYTLIVSLLILLLI